MRVPVNECLQPHFVSCAAALQVSRMGDVTLDTGGTKTVSILVCMCTCRAAQCKPARIDACSSVLWCCAHAFRLKRLQALLNRMLSNSHACRQCTDSRLIMHSCLVTRAFHLAEFLPMIKSSAKIFLCGAARDVPDTEQCTITAGRSPHRLRERQLEHLRRQIPHPLP